MCASVQADIKTKTEGGRMKRFHVHVAVSDLKKSIGFYSSLFGSNPTVTRDDYAKWMLEDPRINFAISERGEAVGVNHLGLQVDDDDELKGMRTLLEKADASLVEEAGANCCYAKSDKYWITDPQGIAWETFHSLGSIPFYNGTTDASVSAGACCTPSFAQAETPAVKALGCCG